MNADTWSQVIPPDEVNPPDKDPDDVNRRAYILTAAIAGVLIGLARGIVKVDAGQGGKTTAQQLVFVALWALAVGAGLALFATAQPVLPNRGWLTFAGLILMAYLLTSHLKLNDWGTQLAVGTFVFGLALDCFIELATRRLKAKPASSDHPPPGASVQAPPTSSSTA